VAHLAISTRRRPQRPKRYACAAVLEMR